MYRSMNKMVYLKESIWFLYSDRLVSYDCASNQKTVWHNPLNPDEQEESEEQAPLIAVKKWIGLPHQNRFQFVSFQNRSEM